MSSDECPSLAGKGLELSTTNRTEGTVVHFSCDDFGHRPSGDIDKVECLTYGNWSSPIPSCEWSWDFSTREQIIFGTSVAAVSFLIIVAIAALIAYFRCYKKRDDLSERMFDSSHPSSSPVTGYNGPYNDRDYNIDPYVIYQDVHDKFDRFEGYQMNGTTEKPWLGYIPRPKVSQEAVYS